MQEFPVYCPSKRLAASFRRVAIVMAAAGWLAGPSASRAADPQPGGQPPSAFQPGDISIGEPIALPFAQPAAAPSGLQAVPPAGPVGAAVPGWLGMSVAESTVPGRWTIVEVSPGGPAAAAGIAIGDELRGVGGRPLASGDDVSEVLTAIAAGQRVRLSVARADRVGDMDVLAMPRPTTTPAAQAASTTAGVSPGAVPHAPAWQSSPDAPRVPATAAPDGVATVSVLTNPPAAASPSASPSPPPGPAPPSVEPAAVRAQPMAAGTGSPRGRTALGVRTVPIDRSIQERFQLPQAAGAYVIGVVGELPAAKAGIPPGSVIVSLADRPVRSPQDLTQLVAGGPTDRPLPLRYVLPGGTEKQAEVVLQSLERPLEEALVGPPLLEPAQAPQLEPGPRAATTRRPLAAGDANTGELRRDLMRIRELLEAVERRLELLGGR